MRMIALAAPAAACFAAFFLLPMLRLVTASLEQAGGVDLYVKALTEARYLEAMAYTVLLSLAVTVVCLAVCGVCGVFLTRNAFPGRATLVSLLTFPLAFPGVVVGFMIILLGGRQGLVGLATKALTGDKLVFAYSLAGLFAGYLYFSIPRVILTIMAAAEKLDPQTEEAARSLGASPWAVVRDVLIPALSPALISSGAICFATSMGAFGTAFTLATNLEVIPITIYTEFTLMANIGMAAALSLMLGLMTWGVLILGRSASGNSVAAAG